MIESGQNRGECSRFETVEEQWKLKSQVNTPSPRRWYSASEKQRILEAADKCVERGSLGKLLRKEGLYHSHLAAWRRQREQGMLEALSGKKRGKHTPEEKRLAQQVAALEKEKAKLEKKLFQERLIIQAQKKY